LSPRGWHKKTLTWRHVGGGSLGYRVVAVYFKQQQWNNSRRLGSFRLSIKLI
jgi:hypothetical protein